MSSPVVLTLGAADHTAAAPPGPDRSSSSTKTRRKAWSWRDHYAQARKIPDGRIIALDLPLSEECTFERLRARSASGFEIPSRHWAEGQVKCLVTFRRAAAHWERISLPVKMPSCCA